MIVLITGASHVGKTLLGKLMVGRYRCPFISIDHLKMGLIRSGKTSLTPKDDEALTEYLWPIIREIMKTAIENCQDLIIEGCYIPFNWRQNFDEQYLESIKFVCFAMTDKYIDEHFDDIQKYACVAEHRLDDSDCTVEKLKADNKRYIEGFRKSGETVTLIDTHYFLAVNGGLYK